ncbi:unnamed protein product, partial [Pylaiella littoralis]
QELALGGGEDDASLGDFDDFLGQPIDLEEVFTSSPKSNLAGAHGSTRKELSFGHSEQGSTRTPDRTASAGNQRRHTTPSLSTQ